MLYVTGRQSILPAHHQRSKHVQNAWSELTEPESIDFFLVTPQQYSYYPVKTVMSNESLKSLHLLLYKNCPLLNQIAAKLNSQSNIQQ
jgi:hypothetical protein